MGRRIIFDDETELNILSCGASNGTLWITFDSKIGFAGIVSLFDNDRTKKIEYYQSDDSEATVFDNYTELRLIQRIDNGYNVWLRKKEE